MRLAKFITAAAIASLTTAPVLANPAAKLSVAGSDRVATKVAGASNQEEGASSGGWIVAALAAAAVIGGIIIIADGDDDPDSN